MEWISIILVLIGGVLAAASTIVGKKPAAKEYIDKVRPYQGWIGVVLLVFGIINLIRFLPLFGGLIQSFYGISILTTIVVGMIAVGFVLGYELIVQYTMQGSDAAKEKAEAVRAKLAPIQSTLGMIAIASALSLLYTVIRFRMMY